MMFAPAARRLGMRPAAEGVRRWWDPLLIVWMAWIFDAVNNLGAVHQTIAEHDGSEVLRVERALHASPELALNTWLAAHHLLSEIVVFWYVNVHGAVTFAVFGWLWWHRPDLLGPLRAALVVVATVGLAVFWAMPVAPPRMLTGHGYVDLVATVHHLPVWQPGNVALDANQLCALPSLHLAWAVWAAVAVWQMADRAWLRLAAVVYPFMTLFAVMATGNHYLADGVVGAAMTGLAVVGADRWWTRRAARAVVASPVTQGAVADV
jgi:PAP2 superfamily